jgi:Protein of unknown function (DUF1360)
VTWQIPTWWALLLLALAAFRLWRLFAEDTITTPLRKRLERLSGPKWEERGYGGLSEFVTCPWCAGAWISIGWWIAWTAWPHWTLIIATPFAISAVVGLIAANIDPVD